MVLVTDYRLFHAPRRRMLHAMRGHRGFSLIELLVVVSIIVVLSSLMLPAIAKIRDAAWISRCSSAQRQIAMAILNYGDDWQGMLVLMRRESDNSWWDTILRQEDFELPTRACPKYTGFGVGRINRPYWFDWVLPTDGRGNNFGSWRPMQSAAVEIALSSIAFKPQRILTGDARASWLDHWEAPHYWYKWEWGGAADPSRHGSTGGVYSFFDGHVKTIPESDTGMGLKSPQANLHY